MPVRGKCYLTLKPVLLFFRIRLSDIDDEIEGSKIHLSLFDLRGADHLAGVSGRGIVLKIDKWQNPRGAGFSV